MEQMEIPSNLDELSREDLVVLSLKIDSSWGVSRGKWSRQKLADRLHLWHTRVQQSAPIRQNVLDVSDDAQDRRKCLECATRNQIAEISARCDSTWHLWKPKWTKALMIDRLIAEADGSFTIF